MRGGEGVGPVELKRKTEGRGERGGGRKRNCQRYVQAITRYVQAIIVTPL